MIRAVTFDAAGTLISPHPGVGAIYAELAATYGIEHSAADLEAAFLPAFRRIQAAWAVPYGADEADARAFWNAVISATFGRQVPPDLCAGLYATFARAARWRVLPGARAALAACAAAGIPTAVVSNFDGRLRPLLRELDLQPTVVVISSEVGRAKPDPAPLQAVCQALGVAPHDILHLGDSEREDGGMCAATGARFWQIQDGIPEIPLATWPGFAPDSA
jgi:putative hydrolase of the HAD superfamily